MSSPKKNFVVDPDYEMSEVVRERVRHKEERENKEKLEKINDVINREFQTELDHRQSQLELIQQRLNQAQKTLHLLRYVLITSYYDENEKIVSQLEESIASNEDSSVSNKNRLHPAVKKLLGNNLNNYKLNFAKAPRKKVKHSDQHQNKIVETLSPTPNVHSNQPDIQQTRTEAQKNNVKEEFDTGRNRKKSKYRVVVGNISKWMPSQSEEDKSTHKWMVYVRGSKESPDISHFVQKVVFYLHPSYQPNDVIELREGPFHLARRGWGEFPLRVKIFFRCPLNKPVDIIHNLKLDKTFTGRQTLGNETIVNLFLYDENKLAEDSSGVLQQESQVSMIIKSEPEDIKDIVHELDNQLDDIKPNYLGTMSNYEHDYCCIGIKQEIKDEFSSQPSTSAATYGHLMEHSYFRGNLPSSASPSNTTESVTVKEEQQTDLIYGITDVEESKNEIIMEPVLDDVKNSSNNFQRVLISNGTVIAIKKRRRPQESLLKKMFQKRFDKMGSEISLLRRTCGTNENVKRSKHEAIENCESIDYEKYKIEFPRHKFKNVSEALPYLFKRMPLITELAADLDYKCLYPYASKSLEEYSGWNIGKRMSCEWFQAKSVGNIVSELSDSKNWTTKSIIMYARSHGYTPLSNYQMFRSKKDSLEEVANGVGHSECVDEPKVIELIEPDFVVDVVNCHPEPEPLKSSVHKPRLIDHNLEMACSYVKQALLDVGVILKPEEIIPGVLFNTAERIVLQAALCLAEDLIRKARANLVVQGNFREETCSIGVEEIYKALRERPQFNVLLKTLINN